MPVSKGGRPRRQPADGGDSLWSGRREDELVRMAQAPGHFSRKIHKVMV